MSSRFPIAYLMAIVAVIAVCLALGNAGGRIDILVPDGISSGLFGMLAILLFFQLIATAMNLRSWKRWLFVIVPSSGLHACWILYLLERDGFKHSINFSSLFVVNLARFAILFTVLEVVVWVIRTWKNPRQMHPDA